MSPTREAQAKKFGERRRNDHVYQLCPDPKLKEWACADVEIVLFHGFQLPGSDPADAHWRTWKMRNSEDCWLETLLPQLLSKDGKQRKARVLSVSYESRLDLGAAATKAGAASKPAGVSEDYTLVEALIPNLICDSDVNVGQTGVPVFLIGHDLGGILIKLFVLGVENWEAHLSEDDTRKAKLRNFLEKLKSVYFFATPHAGAPILDRIAETIELSSGTLHGMFHLMKVLNDKKARVNQDFNHYRKSSRFTTRGIRASRETDLKGEFGQVLVIPEGSERSGVEIFYPYDADHFQVCQPEGEFSSPFKILAQDIGEVLKKQDKSTTPDLHELRERRMNHFKPDSTPACEGVPLYQMCNNATPESSSSRVKR